jgi:hypothetical protein
MSKFAIIKSKFFEKYCKNRYVICILIFTFGIIMLLSYISITKIQTKLIENYSNTELNQITGKLNQGGNSNPMDISALLNKIDLSDIIKRLFGSRCLPGCMSPDSTNRKDSMCKKKINNYGAVLECPWRCNIKEYNKQLDRDIMFKKDMSLNNLKLCSVDNENIDCGGCVPLRTFN